MRMNDSRPASALKTVIQGVLDERRIPTATYRLQFNRGFNFRDAEALVPYLHDLGIGDCYASPLLKSRPDSNHGYDLCDHSALNPALGAEGDFAAFTETLRAHGMGLILDIVPNHMAIGETCNAWWMDVLENGPSSCYASYFDVDWHPVTRELDNKVLLSILQDQYGKVLESGEFRLGYEDGGFFIHYYQTKLPVAPHTFGKILGHQLADLARVLGEGNEHLLELQSILTAVGYLPLPTELAPDKVAERSREKEVIKRRIAALSNASPDVRAAIDATVRLYNGSVGDPRSFDLLDSLLDAQAYRPAYWRVAAEEINYRRFFDINELAAIRVELPEVFQATHQLIFRLLAEGKVTGLRVDHPDGLWNPLQYFRQLQESYVLHKVCYRTEASPADPLVQRFGDASVGVICEPPLLDASVASWLSAQLDRRETTAPSWPLYVVAEKILAEGESLPQDWAVYGTTGYDYLNALNGLFVERRNRAAFDRIYHRFIGAPTNFRSLVNSSKKMIMLVALASEINSLSHKLERIARTNRWYRDFTLNSLVFAIREVIASLAVYRTYIALPAGPSRSDQTYIKAAVARAKKQNPRTARSIFDFIQDTLLLRNLQDFREQGREELVEFVMKFQQITGPVMAKGLEDTVFYVYDRLLSLNEVGGNPEQFGLSVEDFHRQNVERRRSWPRSLLATSTHDTKRSEDVRARINVLSELPEEWKASLARWSQMNAAKKTSVDGEPAPDNNDEYLLYQSLLGAWPMEPCSPEEFAGFKERIFAYMLKATREAKTHGSWINPDEEYDAAVRNFVQAAFDDGAFFDDLRQLERRVAYYGQLNAIAQVLLKLTSPGVPDIYQGNELWDFSLVDPDNRRPVDFAHRRVLLANLKARVERAGKDLVPLARELLDGSLDGRRDGILKLFVTYCALNFRRGHEALFSTGSYLPLEAIGPMREHVCAFARVAGQESVLVVAPRLVVRLTGGVEQPPLGEETWEDTALVLPFKQSGSHYRNFFTGEILSAKAKGRIRSLHMSDVCKHFPVALLERTDDR